MKSLLPHPRHLRHSSSLSNSFLHQHVLHHHQQQLNKSNPSSSSSSSNSILSSIIHQSDQSGQKPNIDPFKLLSPELKKLNLNLSSLLDSNQINLNKVTQHYLSPLTESKHLRPLIILLISKATYNLSPTYPHLDHHHHINQALSPESILTDHNPSAAAAASSSSSSSSSSSNPLNDSSSSPILPSQRRLAEISEMIHVASLLHDDVIDKADSRRSIKSAPFEFGNKLSILAGDFLLARASIGLARLGSLEVVELISSIISNLVEGELMQLNSMGKSKDQIWNEYLQKSYLKTASLIAKTARSAAILSGCGTHQGWEPGELIKDRVYLFGKHLGIAFQIIDDVLDYTSSASILGKPSGGSDLKLGIATAPILYASEQFPELTELIHRKFNQVGDVERAQELVHQSDGIIRSIELAQKYSTEAKELIRSSGIPENEARIGLEKLTEMIIDRVK
ncbi:isoprenoid synthase domain-containing protein [Melampsora americana]|nr:isoprenoid synthase domain-containing protein [Melampsora americana]